MSTFQVSLVSPEALVFSGEVDQVDLPGTEGDFGVLAGHAPIVAMLHPGIVTVAAGAAKLRFVVLGGLAEFSQAELTILADSAGSVDDFDVVEFAARIDDMEKGLTQDVPGAELDRAIVLLDHYKSVHRQLSSYTTTAF
jgi:F-type H+-transporting ATPase subunit epsilon